ncbi:MAG: alpha-L-rhamnosidase-related protein [Terriglobales bacterium]
MTRLRLPSFLFLTAVSVLAAAPPARWHAQWITPPGEGTRDFGVYHFRKSFVLASVPEHFRVYVSADNRFKLLLNGARVGEGPARGDLFHWRYETFDLAPLLHAGANTLAATVWNFGTEGPIAQMTNRTGFLLQGATPAEQMVDTGKDWQVERDRGYSLIRADMGKLHGYLAVGPGEVVDGKRYDWKWSDPGRDAADAPGTDWKPAVTIGAGALRGAQDGPTNWLLVPDELPTMEYSPIAAGRPVRGAEAYPGLAAGHPITIPAHSQASILLDATALRTAYPQLTVSGGAGSRVSLTYAEALRDAHDQKGNRNQIAGKHIVGLADEFLPDGGRNRTFVPLWWRTWRYLQLDIQTGDRALTVEKLSAEFTAYPFQERARFTSDSELLTPVWDTGWRTARLCAHETYMDCPYWEQLQYVGDTRIQALISYVMTGDDRLARQAIEAIDDSRTPDGITQSRYPSALPQYIPTFSLLWVGMLHDYYYYRPDRELVRRMVPRTRTVLDWFLAHQRPDGLLGRLPWWDFVDWTTDFKDGVPPQDADGGSAALTLQFVEALRYGAELESALGEHSRAELYRRAAARAAEAVATQCWDPGRRLIADTPAHQHFSQQANVLAVWLDIIPKARQPEVLRTILAPDAPQSLSRLSYYFRFYLARAVAHAGMADEYLGLLEPWYKMLDMGLSTWAETPEPTRSDCHAWSAHPNYDLLSLVAGIQPALPGFAAVKIAPHLGALRRLNATLPHPDGDITVTYVRGNAGTSADITLPESLTGTFEWKGKSYPLHAGKQSLELP